MTYYYKIKGTLARKEGGNPPLVDEYVAIGKDNVVRHVKNDMIIEEEQIVFPPDATNSELKEVYKSGMGFMITKNMLYPKYRRKRTCKPKPVRKNKR